MNIQEAKDKLYEELRYTIGEYGGTEADLLELIEQFSYLDGEIPVFSNEEGIQLSIKQFMKKQKSNLEKALKALDIKYNKVSDIAGAEYKIFGGKLTIQEEDKYYTLSINVDSSHDITLYLLSFQDMIGIVIDNKDKFQ